MLGKKDKSEKKKGISLFGIKIEKNIKKAEEAIKKDIEVVKEDIKKLDTPESAGFFITYGWAILIIIIGIGGFIWWQYFNVHTEICDFPEGSGLLCENFDVTNDSMSFEIRNLNNKSISINQLVVDSCMINPEQEIPSNDKRQFTISCNRSSGKMRDELVIAYKLEDFQKHSVAKLAKIVP